jgi:transposase InsO family protein
MANTNVSEKAARRKLSLLELAEELGNVSRACKIVGYSRQQFYEIRRDFQTYGAQGLLDRLPGPKNPHPNRVSPEVEARILEYSLQFPTHGCLRVSQQLKLEGVSVGSGGVRGVWQRNDLISRHQRLLRLEHHARDTPIELTEAQVRMLERFEPEFRERHITADYPGHLVAQDTFMVGHLTGVGRVYLQTVIDCHSRYAFGRLYTSKVPVTAVHILNTDVIPFFESHGTPIRTILTDNGREFCGRPDQHPFELFLQLEEIEHRTTPIRRPQSNGYVERLHRTLLDEHFRLKGRQKFYEAIDQMQSDLDEFLAYYNAERAHQGRNMNGRTPVQVFTAQPDTQQEVPRNATTSVNTRTPVTTG